MTTLKRLTALVLIVGIAMPAFAHPLLFHPAAGLEDGQVMYIGGTVAGVKEAAIGKLDTAQGASLVFTYDGGKFTIPYESISSYEYTEKMARYLGVVAFIAVAMVKHLQRRHFFRILYKDEAGVAQAAVFEVPKSMPDTLLAVLQVRATHGCRSYGETPCNQRRIATPYPASYGSRPAVIVMEPVPVQYTPAPSGSSTTNAEPAAKPSSTTPSTSGQAFTTPSAQPAQPAQPVQVRPAPSPAQATHAAQPMPQPQPAPAPSTPGDN